MHIMVQKFGGGCWHHKILVGDPFWHHSTPVAGTFTLHHHTTPAAHTPALHHTTPSADISIAS